MSFDAPIPSPENHDAERNERIERLLIPEGFHNSTSELLDALGAVIEELDVEVSRQAKFWNGSKHIDVLQRQVVASRIMFTQVTIAEVLRQSPDEQDMIIKTITYRANEAFGVAESIVLHRKDDQGLYQPYWPDGLDLYHEYGLTPNGRIEPYGRLDAELIDEQYQAAQSDMV